MGREAVTHVDLGGQVAEVRVLLEGHEIILRGDLKGRFPISSLSQPSVDGDDLVIQRAGGPLRISLGAVEAAKWLARLTKPLPTLAEKLGLTKGAKARVMGPWQDDADLAAALTGQIETGAGLLVAVCLTPEDLDAAETEATSAQIPAWFVHPKGKGAVNDATVRARMRPRGFVDTKACAVSDRLTATRYQPRAS